MNGLSPTAADRTQRELIVTALALALGAAVSLGLARFSYALLLPPMRADLGWSYFTAGAMNTANAAGYLLGALVMPWALRRRTARTLFVAGSATAAALLALHATVRIVEPLYALRLLLGVSSAVTFVTGGVLAARLGQTPGARPTLILGLYYGGTGLGIIASTALVPPLVAQAADWPRAWWALAFAAAGACALMALGTRSILEPPHTGGPATAVWRWRDFAFGLAGYTMFGLGYIGYMTFIVTLLREQGVSPGVVIAFYALLGAGVVASSWLWAPLLARFRGGQPMAVLNGLLALATVLPVLTSHPLVILASGALFGGVFLSVVASTTALVRHNLPPGAWATGITAFTVVFATGQIAGPSLVGWVADGGGGLLRGLALSAAVLAFGALLALGQRPMPLAPPKTTPQESAGREAHG